jgi:hypothetical protein
VARKEGKISAGISTEGLFLGELSAEDASCILYSGPLRSITPANPSMRRMQLAGLKQ